MDDGRSATFIVSLEGITETEAAGPHKFCTTIAIARQRQVPCPATLLPGVAVRHDGDGTGIPEEVQPHLFEPFFTTKSQVGRIGVGLSSAYGIVQQHHGQITFSSTPGEGTKFNVYLPARISSVAVGINAAA